MAVLLHYSVCQISSDGPFLGVFFMTLDDIFHLVYAIGLIAIFASGFNSGYQR